MQEMWVQSLDWEDPLEKEMATRSSILAWEIPWTEELWHHEGSDTTEHTGQPAGVCTCSSQPPSLSLPHLSHFLFKNSFEFYIEV